LRHFPDGDNNNELQKLSRATAFTTSYASNEVSALTAPVSSLHLQLQQVNDSALLTEWKSVV